MDIHKIINAIGAVIGAAIGAAFAGWSWTPLHSILVIFMIVDYLTGVMVAALGLSPKSETGHLSSKVGFTGLAKKAFIVLFVLLGAALDTALGATVFQSMIICMYIANEGLSIIENASLLGVPIPKALQDALEIMRQKGEGEQPEPASNTSRLTGSAQTAGSLPDDHDEKPPDYDDDI